MTEKKTCARCNRDMPKGRHKNEFCSKQCEVQVLGYSPYYISAKKLKSEVAAIASFKPDPLEPIFKVVSEKPIPIFSDLHLPLVSEEWLNHAIKCAQIWGSEVLILNGDVLDNNEISRHMGSYYRRGKQLQDDFESTEAFLKVVCPMFKQVIWLSGNHCLERLIKLFRGELSADRVAKLVGSFDNLKITARSYIDVNDNVRLCHPRQYSRIRGALAQRLANRWQMHIATGHQHHAAMTYSTCGKYQAVDVPTMADVDVQDYVRNELNDFPEPMQGFGCVFGDFIQVFTKNTKWELFNLPSFEEK